MIFSACCVVLTQIGSTYGVISINNETSRLFKVPYASLSPILFVFRDIHQPRLFRNENCYNNNQAGVAAYLFHLPFVDEHQKQTRWHTIGMLFVSSLPHFLCLPPPPPSLLLLVKANRRKQLLHSAISPSTLPLRYYITGSRRVGRTAPLCRRSPI